MKKLSVLLSSVLLTVALVGCSQPAEAPVSPSPEVAVTATPEPTPDPTPEPTATPEPTPAFGDLPVVPGLVCENIWVNFEQDWGIEQTASNDSSDYYDSYSSGIFVDSGELSYSFYCSPDALEGYSKVVSHVEFFAASTDPSVVELFLGYAATIPYDGADPQAARDWVQTGLSDLSGADAGTTLTASFGSANFELTSMSSGAMLTVESPGWDEWLTNYMMETYS